MGDLPDWSPESNGPFLEERPISGSNSVGPERWGIAEQATQWIISQVLPTTVSEERRRAVIDYVQRLIRGYIGCEVFPFGSVPLKTYLPDGDIDLTAFGVPNVVDSLVSDVSSVLEGEEQGTDAEFVVKDVQIINAEVKLVKCLVQNIVVDISFNQLGGLCTLCFLEQVDRLIGKNHLFKRSIILTKAWCYYESRILGAHHGLISTYALETLVLYIFHLFHSSLNGPLEVLYRFLDYFSKFDWDNYCISVNGPVRLSSLPEIVAERPDNGGLDLLLSNDFLRECVDMFSVPSRGHEMNSRTFLQKHLNIVDPLKENNNLGRSISKGNSYRIRSAFTYGARKLGRILLQPEENIAEELRKFFMNTLDRHGSGQRPDVQDSFPMSSYNGYGPVMSIEHFQEDKMVSVSNSAESRGINGESRFKSEELLQNGVMKVKINSTTDDEPQNGSKGGAVSTSMSEDDNFTLGSAVSGSRLCGDAKDLATSRMSSLRISEDMPRYDPLGGKDSISSLSKGRQAPHLCFSHLSMGNAKISNDLDVNHLARNNEFVNSGGSNDSPPNSSSVASFAKDFYPGRLERAPPAGPTPTPEAAVKAILDISGDYDTHFHSLQYGRWCYEYALSAPISPMPLPLPSHFQINNSWNSIPRLPQFKRGPYSHVSANGVVPRPAAFFPISPPRTIPGSPFAAEELPKPRGTGTYFPNTNHQLNRARLPPARVKNHVPLRSPRTNGWASSPLEGNREGSPAQCSTKDLSAGLLLSDEKAVEFGSFGQLQLGAAPIVVGSSRSPGASGMQSSNLSPPTLGMQREKSVFAENEDRVAIQLYRLKDEEDFPPLST